MPTAAGWVFLVVMCAVLPWLAVRSGRRARRPGGTPTRAQYFAGVAAGQFIPLMMAISAAKYEWVELFPALRVSAATVGAGVLFLIVTLGTLPWRWATKGEDERRRMLWMMPNRPADLWWWALVALVAGFGEEVVYRGVMFELWRRMVGAWGAAAICVAVFTLVHFVQGRRAMAIIALMAAGFHLLVWLNGNLYAAMVVHAAYDLAAGWMVMRLAYRDGLLPVEAASGGVTRSAE